METDAWCSEKVISVVTVSVDEAPDACGGSSRNASLGELLLVGCEASPWGTVGSGTGALNEMGDEPNSTVLCLDP